MVSRRDAIVLLFSLFLITIVYSDVEQSDLDIGDTESLNVTYFTSELVGGNITTNNISGNTSTGKWAAVYGNASDSFIFLGSGSGAAPTGIFYEWDWNVTSGGKICAVRAPGNTDWSDLNNVSSIYVDTVWGFNSSHVDSANKTFNSTPADFTMAGQTVVNCSRAKTGPRIPEDPYYTNLLKMISGNPTSKNEFAFCTELNGTGVTFKNESYNYELIMPTNSTPSTTETYYLYMELT